MRAFRQLVRSRYGFRRTKRHGRHGDGQSRGFRSTQTVMRMHRDVERKDN